MVALLVPGLALAAGIEDHRRSTREWLAVEVQRSVLPNGLVVLLSPDPNASSVAVWMSFRAGALYEPKERGGLAHLVEHLMFTGTTRDTGYAALLERRRARFINAETGFDSMSFEAVVPAEELPLALWVAGDRLGTLPSRIDVAALERQRQVILQERALRDVDAPYGLIRERVFTELYARPHPLHGGVIGAPDELAAVTLDDVRRFAAEYLVPANGVLVVAGRFDPAVARRLVDQELGRLPAGHPAPFPAAPPPVGPLAAQQAEPLSRLPRVTLAWRLPAIPHQDAAALELGAMLLTFLTDGAWGMGIDADLHEYAGESLFTMELTVPYDEKASAVEQDASAFLRLLTLREMPLELMNAANLALDRSVLFGLDSVGWRAQLLAQHELRVGPQIELTDELARHWALEGGLVRDMARVYLKEPHLVLHARPTRPRPARAERQ
jgi:zinc protease